MNQIRSMLLFGFLLIFMDRKGSVKANYGCICPEIYAPVCGSDGQSYGNECFLECEEYVSKVSEGECSTPAPDCICTDQYEPVCGSDGVTYGNICDLNCSGGENVYVVSQGPCPTGQPPSSSDESPSDSDESSDEP